MRGLGSQQAQGHAPATLQASGVDQFFDYATFLWTDGGLLGHTELELDSDWMVITLFAMHLRSTCRI